MDLLPEISQPFRDDDNSLLSFFFNDTATTEIYTLSLHDALPICIEGVLFGASLPGAGLPLGELPIVLPVSGVVVGGEADGTRSRFGVSPTRPPPWFESVHPATSALSSTNAQNPDRSVLILLILPGGASPYPLIWTAVATF